LFRRLGCVLAGAPIGQDAVLLDIGPLLSIGRMPSLLPGQRESAGRAPAHRRRVRGGELEPVARRQPVVCRSAEFHCA
jgi:hypothetical protein